MPKVNFKEKQIYYSSHGKGNCLVLLHGFLESGEIWKNFARNLSQHFQVITIDLPGHGKSDVLNDKNSMDLMAEAVNEVLKHLEISNCVMTGHSMGGYVALAFAEKYGSKLKGLVLFHSHAFADLPKARKNRDRTIKIVEKDRKDFILNFIPDLFDPANKEKFSVQIEELRRIALQATAEGIIAALESMKSRPDRTHVLVQAKFPVLFIIGKHDPKIPMENLVVQATLPSHCETLSLDNVGHMGFIEASDETCRALMHFSLRIYGS